jgi:hypothetical protein
MIMALWRIVWIGIIVLVGVYTALVISVHGWGLYSVFFGDIATVAWPGQFNLDFLMLLTLSGLWVAWRHQWSVAGFVLGIGAANLGAPFLCAYLLITSLRVRGDAAALLLGEQRAIALRVS